MSEMNVQHEKNVNVTARTECRKLLIFNVKIYKVKMQEKMCI